MRNSFTLSLFRLLSLACISVSLLVFSSGKVLGQTNPTPQSLPFSQDFSTFNGSQTTYPAGIQGWTISGSTSTSYPTAAPNGDQALAGGGNNTTSSGVFDMNGKIGLMNTASALRSVVVSINTSGLQSISVSYQVATQRQQTGNRIGGIGLQYRVGTEGTFTNVADTEYQNDISVDNTSGTGSLNPQTKSITLPSACDNQSVVQLRWVYREVSGSGNRPSFSVDNISISGTSGGPATVSAPVFSPVAGTFYAPVDVTITSATAGASIYYTTNGTDPTESSTLYTAPVSISSTTTLKARAYKAGDTPSSISTAEYVFPAITDVANIAALRAGTTGGPVYRLTGEAVQTLRVNNRNQRYIQDGTGAILIDDPNPAKITTNYNNGDGITGITGTLSVFNNMLQFVPVMDPGPASSTGNVVAPVNVTLNNLDATYQARLVKVENIAITGSGNFASGTSYTITDPSGTGVLRTAYSELDYIGQPIPALNQDITGVVLQFSADFQLIPRSLADFSNHVAASPTLVAVPTTLSGFFYITGTGPSASQSFSLSGASLNGSNVTVSAPADYEVSLDDATYSASVTLTAFSGASTTVYVRLKAGLAVGEYDGQTINITGGGATAIQVSCNGSVSETGYLVDFEGTGETKTSYASGTVTLSGLQWNMTEALIGTALADWKNGVRSARMQGYGTSAMTMLQNKTGGMGVVAFNYRRYGTDSQVDWRVEYSTNNGVSWTQIGTDFTAPASDDVQRFSATVNVGGSVRLRIKRATETGSSNARLNIDDIFISDFAADEFATDPASLSGFEYMQGSGPSLHKSFTLTSFGQDGSNVSIAAPSGYEISLDNTTYSASIMLTAYNGAAQTVYVRLAAGLTAGAKTGQISITGGGLPARQMDLSGTVLSSLDLPVSGAFQTQEQIDQALTLGYSFFNYSVESAGGGYLRFFLGGYMQTPVIDYSGFNQLLVSFDAMTYGGETGQTLSVFYSTDGGSTFQFHSSVVLTSSYQTYQFEIDLGGTKSAGVVVQVAMTSGTNSARFRQFNASGANVLAVPLSVATVLLTMLAIGLAGVWIHRKI